MGAAAAAGNLVGAALGWQGSKPKVPPAPSVDTSVSGKKMVAANQAILPGAENLASQLNVFNEQQLQAMLAKAIPDYAKIKEQTSANILSMLKGEIPDATQVATRAAEKAVGGGFGGSGAASNLTLRDLSVDSLKYTTAGISAADRWLSSGGGGGVARMADPSAMFISPAQQLSVDTMNAENAWNVQWLSNRLSAMPSPTEKAAQGLLTEVGSNIDEVGAAAAGMFTGGALSKVGQTPFDASLSQPWSMSSGGGMGGSPMTGDFGGGTGGFGSSGGVGGFGSMSDAALGF